MSGSRQRPLGVVVGVAGLLAGDDDVVPDVSRAKQVDEAGLLHQESVPSDVGGHRPQDSC